MLDFVKGEWGSEFFGLSHVMSPHLIYFSFWGHFFVYRRVIYFEFVFDVGISFHQFPDRFRNDWRL